MINLRVDLLSIESIEDQESVFTKVLESEMYENIAILHDRRFDLGLNEQFN